MIGTYFLLSIFSSYTLETLFERKTWKSFSSSWFYHLVSITRGFLVFGTLVTRFLFLESPNRTAGVLTQNNVPPVPIGKTTD